MRKRRKNERQKCCSAALALLILCSWMVSSIIVYGFDMSGMDSFDTGGFDMNVGEGAGQLPEDWEGSYGGTENDNSNRDTEKTGEDPNTGTVTENEQEDSYQWNPDFQENENPGTTIEEEANTVNTPAEGLTETSAPTKTPMPTKPPVPTQTSSAILSATPVPKSVRKSIQKPTAGASRKKKDQNPALSYYQTEPAETPDKKAEKEQTPTIHAEIDGNRVQIEIRPDIPFQILSFRINGKECDFYWYGKKLLAKLPEKTRKPWKAELLGFVKSGKLYHESMDLTEKQ